MTTRRPPCTKPSRRSRPAHPGPRCAFFKLALLAASAWAFTGAPEPAIAGSAIDDHALTPLQSLSFGSFASAYEGTLTITPEGARVSTGGVVPISQVLGTPGELRFITATDQASTPCRVTIPRQITLRDTAGSGGEMVATGFTYRLLAPRPYGIDRVARHIKVGATLHVSAHQSPGNYTGTLPTIVEYQ